MALHKYLSIFNRVIERGERRNDKYHSHGLTAWHDFEGYTCFIGYRELTMTIYFHNKYTYDTPDRQTLTEFETLIDQLTNDKAFHG